MVKISWNNSFENNFNEGTNIRTVWDIRKAFMRGHSIQCKSKLKKQRQEKVQAILDEIKMKEALKKFSDNKTILQQIKLL